VGFRRHRNSFGFETRARPWLGLGAAFGFGTNINFDPAEGLPPYEGDEIEGELRLVLFPVPRLRLEGTYLYNRMRTNQASGVAPPGEPIFTNHILRTKLSYQFSRALSLRAILDYESVLPNLSLVDVDDERRFAVDLLLTYQLNPWTAFYVGYTDSRENFALVETADERFLRRTASPTLTTGRQFFVKVSYLWRF
jgi:hypothetical protein